MWEAPPTTWNASARNPALTSGFLSLQSLERSSRTFSTSHLTSFVPSARKATPKHPQTLVSSLPKQPGLAHRETQPRHLTASTLATPSRPQPIHPGTPAVACILTSVLTPPAAPLPGLSAASKSFSARLHTGRPEVRPRGPLSAGDRKGVFVLIYPPGGSDLPADVHSRLSTS